MSFENAAVTGGALHIGFVAALDVECACLRRAAARDASWLVLQSGPGSARAAAAATRAIEAGAGLLVSWGLAGALAAAVAPGTVLLPRRVVADGAAPLAVDATWRERLAALADEFRVEHGDLLTVPAALESPAAKRAAAEATGAVAVDMESASVAATAAQAGVPFVALRVVVDALDDWLPSGAEQWIDERGHRRFAPALRAVVSVGQWRPLVTLARRYRVATRVLDRLAVALVERSVLAAGAPSRRARS